MWWEYSAFLHTLTHSLFHIREGLGKNPSFRLQALRPELEIYAGKAKHERAPSKKNGLIIEYRTLLLSVTAGLALTQAYV